MPAERKIRSIILPLLALGFLAGIAHLFLQRFEAGDVYPAYSSLRADPLGTKVLYESMENLDGITVSRNYLPIPRLRDPGGTTLMVFGARPGALNYVDEAEVRALEAFLDGGGRLVVLLYPRPFPKSAVKSEDPDGRPDRDGKPGKDAVEGTKEADRKETDKKDTDKKDTEKKDTEKKEKAVRDAPPSSVSLPERWKFATTGDGAPVVSERDRFPVALRAQSVTGLSSSVTWHSALRFRDLGDAWRTVYAVDSGPVLVERSYGRGSIVLSTDSYFVSNEALLKERHADLLAWLAGGSRTILFDETVHGIEETPGVASLGRKYRLHGLFGGIVALALLFVWKYAVSLVPPRTGPGPADHEGAAEGKDSLSGFVGLLRRTISSRDVLGACVREWKQTTPRRRGSDAETLRRVQTIVDAEERRPHKQRDPLDAYRKISTLLVERKMKT